jgi:protein phosphatase 2C
LDAGDHYLRPYVISKPEVTVTKRSDKDEFLILASDGLWDVISNEVACQVVKRCLDGRMRRNSVEAENESRAAQAAEVLAELAMARGSKDNTSVIVVDLRKPKGFLTQ